MSCTSIAASIDNVPSLSILKSPEQNTKSFMDFLSGSPYGSPLPSPKPKIAGQKKSVRIILPMEESTRISQEEADLIDPKRLSLMSIGSINKAKKNNDSNPSSLYYDLPETQSSLKTSSMTSIKEESQRSRTSVNKNRSVQMLEPFPRGFDAPSGHRTDAESEKMIRELQEKIMGLEKENGRLRKRNYDLENENKDMKEKMAVVAAGQEKVKQMHEDYEKKIVKLRENCVSNTEIANSLKDILVLQEREIFDRISKKEPRKRVNNRYRFSVKTSDGHNISTTNIQPKSVTSLVDITGSKAPNNDSYPLIRSSPTLIMDNLSTPKSLNALRGLKAGNVSVSVSSTKR